MIPVLGPDAWLDDPVKEGQVLFMHYLLSNKSQTNLYFNMIRSFPADLAENISDVRACSRAVENSLISLYSPLFDTVEITVTPVESDTESSQAMNIYITYSRNNITYNLSNIIKFNDSGLQKVIDISNGSETDVTF